MWWLAVSLPIKDVSCFVFVMFIRKRHQVGLHFSLQFWLTFSLEKKPTLVSNYWGAVVPPHLTSGKVGLETRSMVTRLDQVASVVERLLMVSRVVRSLMILWSLHFSCRILPTALRTIWFLPFFLRSLHQSIIAGLVLSSPSLSFSLTSSASSRPSPLA